MVAQRKPPEGKSQLQELLDQLEFDEKTLAHALMNQASLLLKASRYRIEKMKARIQAEHDFDQIQVTEAMGIRADAMESQTKLTEKGIEERVLSSEKVKEARVRFDESRAMEEYSKLVLNAFESRGSMAKALVQLLGAEAAAESGLVRATLDQMGIDKLRDSVSSKFPGKKS